MKFFKGDYVSGVGIGTGRYLGQEKVSAAGSVKTFHKVEESDRGLVHYLPVEEELNLRKLPSKSTFKKYLNRMKTPKLIDVGEVEGSRYRYFKAKFLRGSLKSTLEVFHDLNLFKKNKKLSVSEKKLFNNIKDKLTHELAFVLELEEEKAEEMVLNIGSAA